MKNINNYTYMSSIVGFGYKPTMFIPDDRLDRMIGRLKDRVTKVMPAPNKEHLIPGDFLPRIPGYEDDLGRSVREAFIKPTTLNEMTPSSRSSFLANKNLDWLEEVKRRRQYPTDARIMPEWSNDYTKNKLTNTWYNSKVNLDKSIAGKYAENPYNLTSLNVYNGNMPST